MVPFLGALFLRRFYMGRLKKWKREGFSPAGWRSLWRLQFSGRMHPVIAGIRGTGNFVSTLLSELLLRFGFFAVYSVVGGLFFHFFWSSFLPVLLWVFLVLIGKPFQATTSTGLLLTLVFSVGFSVSILMVARSLSNCYRWLESLLMKWGLVPTS